MSKFKEGDYVVITNGWTSQSHLQENWIHICTKVSMNKYVYVNESANNSIKCFRHATSVEIAEYERLGEPFNVNTLKPKFEVDLTGRYLKALIDKPQSTSLKEGDEIEIIKRLSDNRYQLVGDWTYTTNNLSATDWEVLPEDKIKAELTINDLVEGEIYYSEGTNGPYIFVFKSTKGNYINVHHKIRQGMSDHTKSTGLNNCHHANLRLANQSERQWLEACIKADKFIPKDEVLNQKPEYVEYKGKIYKVKEWTPHAYCRLVNSTKLEPFKDLVKLSTKEAFEAQNSEFILPEKWCVKITKDGFNDIYSWFDKFGSRKTGYESCIRNGYGVCSGDDNAIMHFPSSTGGYHQEASVLNGYTEITFDQFKQYVLKDEVVEPKKSEFEYGHWYTYSKSKSILYFATQEKCAYGFNTKGEWEEVTQRNFETHSDLWTKASQEEVETRLIEYAKKKYPVGIKIKTVDYKVGEIVRVQQFYSGDMNQIYCKTDGDPTYRKLTSDGKWAEIIKEEVRVNIENRSVHCSNQAEWDFAAKKLDRRSYVEYNDCGDSIKLNQPDVSNFKKKLKSRDNWEVLSFQQWLDGFGHNEAWRKVIDVDFGEVKPEFKAGDKLVGTCGEYIIHSVEEDHHNKLGKPGEYFIADKIEYSSDRIKLWSNGSYWYCKINEISSYEEPTIQRETVGNVGPKTITQTSFNRDFHVKVNSQEEADAMFDYLRSKGEKIDSEYVYFTKKAKFVIPFHNDNGEVQDWMLNEEPEKTPERPLSDFINIPASTNDSDPLTPEKCYLIPEPKVQELVGTEKYFPKEEELSLDDLLREV